MRGLVVTGNTVKFDLAKIGDHRGSIAHDAHDRSLLHTQPNRQSLDVVVALQRDVKKLHVECKAIDSRDAEEIICNVTTESFEPALRVEPTTRNESSNDE